MARIPRILVTGDPTVYHIISRTALQGFPLEDIEKDFLVEQMKHASQLWFVDIMGFCCMGNHFHLLVRMLPDTDFSDADMLKRLAAYYGDDRIFGADQLPTYRQKLASLSEFVGEIKVRFARFYNKRHGRRGYFWGDRFKSVVVENGETLVNCLAYMEVRDRHLLLDSPPRARLYLHPSLIEPQQNPGTGNHCLTTSSCPAIFTTQFNRAANYGHTSKYRTKGDPVMARIPRILITGDPTVYHIISRTALQNKTQGQAIIA